MGREHLFDALAGLGALLILVALACWSIPAAIGFLGIVLVILGLWGAKLWVS